MCILVYEQFIPHMRNYFSRSRLEIVNKLRMNLVVKTESDCDEVYSDDNLMKQHPFINIVNTKLKQERDDFYCNVSGEESCCDSHPNDYSTDDSDSDKSDCDNEELIESSKEEDISSVQVKAEKDDGGAVFQFIKQEPFDQKEDKYGFWNVIRPTVVISVFCNLIRDCFKNFMYFQLTKYF